MWHRERDRQRQWNEIQRLEKEMDIDYICGKEKKIGRDSGTRFRDKRQRGTETMRHR